MAAGKIGFQGHFLPCLEDLVDVPERRAGRFELGQDRPTAGLEVMVEGLDVKRPLVAEGVVEALAPDADVLEQLAHPARLVPVLPEKEHRFLEHIVAIELFLRSGGS